MTQFLTAPRCSSIPLFQARTFTTHLTHSCLSPRTFRSLRRVDTPPRGAAVRDTTGVPAEPHIIESPYTTHLLPTGGRRGPKATLSPLQLPSNACRPCEPRPVRVMAPPRAAATAATPSAGDVQGEMLAPSIFNNHFFRLAATVATLAVAAKSSAYLPAQALSFVHLLAYGTWLGTIVWTTFVAGIVMFKNLPRQTFGRLQSKLFPIYFGLSTGVSAVLLGTLCLGGAAPPQKALITLGVGLVGSLVNLLWVEPTATSNMFKRYELENAEGPRDEEAIKKLYKAFGKWHGISSLFNLAVLVAAIAHGWWLAGYLALA